MSSFTSEASLGPPVLSWLGERGYDLYQEVAVGSWSADIVGVLGPLVCVVELKRSFTFEVVAQALSRTRYAHHVYVAVPAAKGSDGRRLAESICASHGIGVLYLHPAQQYPGQHQSALATQIKGALHERQKTFAAAGTKGTRWTEFKATVEQVQRAVAKEPGITLKACIESFKHHYANDKSARAHLSHWIDNGTIKGIRIEREGKLLRLYPVAAEGAAS